MKRAFLTKVAVQTFWVVIDDETETAAEMSDSGVLIPASEWPGFEERHRTDFEAIQAAVEAADKAPSNGAPNRAARRSKGRPSARGPMAAPPTPGP